ncbi:MAG: hypothetical protein SGCHY_001934 [Lobulomycetales sp.]
MAPTVLVLGGVGFIGRNLVIYLVENKLADYIRVADKAMPETSYFNERAKAAFADPCVDCRQANLANASVTEKIFTDGDKTWDIVFNLAAETKYGQTEEVYTEKVFGLSVTVAKEAVKRNVPVFVEFSTAQIYESDKKASSEDTKHVKPWTQIAKCKLKAEQELTKILGSKLIIMRPAIVYGPSDILGITPRLIVGAVYKQLKEEMKLLWTKDLRINTVHVNDVVRASWWAAATKSQGGGRAEGDLNGPCVYNLADKTDTDQGKMNEFIRQIFGIDTGFQGTVLSSFAKMNLESVTEEVNDKHLQPWADACKEGSIQNTPLTPYLDKELLKDNALSVNGSKIETTLGFQYTVPLMTKESLMEVIDDFVSVGIWPKGTVG